MKVDLENKKWPTCPYIRKGLKPEDIRRYLRLRSDYVKSAFIDEGHIETRPLGHTDFTKPIPAGEIAITSLCCDRRGRIIGGTSGKRSHIFFYDPSPDADTVVDVGTIGENKRVTSLVPHKDGRIFGATSSSDKEKKTKGEIFCYVPCETASVSFDNIDISDARKIMDTPPKDWVISSIDDSTYSCGKIQILNHPFSDEGISSLVIDRDNKYIYGLSDKTGIFFVYEISSGKVELKGKIDEIGEFSSHLIIDSNDNVYGAGLEGRLFKYNPQVRSIEKLNSFIPSLKGRRLYSRLDSWARDDFNGLIYGGTIEGLLFCFNPHEESIITLGKPVREERIRALTVGKDGKVYGVGGEEGGCAHLFCYNPETRDLNDLGLPLTAVTNHWYGYEFEAATTGKFGEIYLGEYDRISHLFIYFPPIPERKRA